MEARKFIPFYRDVELCQKIWFGKYKGQLLYQIIEKDPAYVAWCREHIENFNLTEEAHNYLVEMEKPEMTETQFQKFWERFKKGEPGVLDKAKAHFRCEGLDRMVAIYKQFEKLRK